ALAIPLIQVVQFDQATFTSYRAIGHVLVAMLIGLPAIGVWTMVQRVYFAFEDTRFLFFVQIPMALLQILGSLASFLLLDVHWWATSHCGANCPLSTAHVCCVPICGCCWPQFRQLPPAGDCCTCGGCRPPSSARWRGWCCSAH